ncbi:MAG TPA: hypothetical protein VLA67_11950 [Nitrospiraceae bacterium]|nr:hypothetical protein [Nitrospiraceae bacterium]
MKPIHWLTALALCLLFSPALAHAADNNITVVRVTPALDLDQLQYVLSHKREEVFDQGMALAPPQSDVFWGVYHQYKKEKDQLDAKRLRLLGTYIGKFASMTGDDAMKLVKASGENQQADLALRQKYFKILSKKLDPVVAARFAQIDDMVGMVIRLAILGNVPLISGVSATTDQPVGSTEPAPAPTPQQ